MSNTSLQHIYVSEYLELKHFKELFLLKSMWYSDYKES